MERKSYTITVYKKDARYKDGKAKIWYANFELTGEELAEELKKTVEVAGQYMDLRKVIVSCEPFRTVTSLMSGKQVQIAANTPLCCDPSSETYWSM